MIKCKSRWLISFLLTASLTLLAKSVMADTVELAYFVWSEEDKTGSKILVSRHVRNSWSAPQAVFSDNHLNILPAVAVTPAGALLVVWSAVNENGIKLKYRRGLATGEGTINWDAQAVLADQLITNLAPVVIHDEHSAFWVFWSANDGADDDVYLSRSIAGGWTPQARVHVQNSVPDALPEVGLDLGGSVWVRWDTFVDRQIEQQLAVFNVEDSKPAGNRHNATTDTTIDPDSLKKQSEEQYPLEPPAFFQSRSRATMYIVADTPYPSRLFPGNLLQ